MLLTICAAGGVDRTAVAAMEMGRTTPGTDT